MMKSLLVWFALIALAVARGADDKAQETPPPSMPSEVLLTSGRTLRGVKVVRWERDRVVLKHAAGVDPIAFSIIKSVPRADLERMRDLGMAAAKIDMEVKRDAHAKRLEAEAAERERQERFERLVSEHKIAVGMSAEQLERSWGSPTKKNISAGSYGRSEQWVYRDSNAYVYVESGAVTSWQVER